jgi:hypothetical protein
LGKRRDAYQDGGDFVEDVDGLLGGGVFVCWVGGHGYFMSEGEGLGLYIICFDVVVDCVKSWCEVEGEGCSWWGARWNAIR